MKIIKKVLIVIVALLAIAVIIPLFINGEYTVEKEVSIGGIIFY